MRLPQITFGKVLAGTAVVLLVGTGTAYAAATIGSAQIINGSIRSIDIKNNTVASSDIKAEAVSSGDIRTGAVTTSEILDGTISTLDVLDGGLAGADLADSSVTSLQILNGTLTSADILDGTVTSADIADDSITGGDIADFQLTNQDVGVLFAQVNANGTIANSSGGVTGVHINPGQYEVDFGRNIASCAFVATQGEAGVGGAAGGITGATDRLANAEAVFVTMNDAADVAVDRAFQLLVVC